MVVGQVQSGKTADFAAVKGLLDADGAMRAGQYNAFKCQHGLTPGEPYTFVIDLKLPRGFTRTKKWQGYLWNGKGDQDAIAFLYLENTSENDIRLWYESGGYTKSKVAEPVQAKPRSSPTRGAAIPNLPHR